MDGLRLGANALDRNSKQEIRVAPDSCPSSIHWNARFRWVFVPIPVYRPDPAVKARAVFPRKPHCKAIRARPVVARGRRRKPTATRFGASLYNAVMKIASWNVNSLKVRLPQLTQWMADAQPDIGALQETKPEKA